MKAIEILAESRKNKVTEAPTNVVKQGLKRLGAGVLGAMGAKGMAGQLAGDADQGAKANELFGNFKQYLAQIGKDKKTAVVQDLEDFLVKNKLSTKLMKTMSINSWKDIDKFFTAMAQDSFKGNAGSGSATSGDQVEPTMSPAKRTDAPAAGSNKTSTAQARADADSLIKSISGIRSRDRQKVVDYIKQQLDTLSTAPSSTTSSAIGAMANQLGRTSSTTSTGGTATTTATGVRNRAGATNPNQKSKVTPAV